MNSLLETLRPYLVFLAGTVAGYIVNESIDWAREQSRSHRRKESWKVANRRWAAKRNMSSGLDVVYSDLLGTGFSRDSVVISLRRSLQIHKEIATKVLDPNSLRWSKKGITDEIQIGAIAIDPSRVSDSAQVESHRLAIGAREIDYFSVMATNWSLAFGAEEERDFLTKFVPSRLPLEPVPEFANPISVGLTLICEDGRILILGKRSNRPSSGGIWWPNSIYNPIGETMNPKDIDSSLDGKMGFSPWRTAERGLFEEMGWHASDIEDAYPILHSFVWDNRILDYKFFGYAVTPLSCAEIYQRWIDAPDRPESQRIDFVPIQNRAQSLELCRRIVEESEDWSSEASFCTIRTLLHLEKIRSKDIDELPL